MAAPRKPVPPQLPLALGLKDSTLFANYIGGDNAEVLNYLSSLPPPEPVPCVYLWGGSGVGKTHLLQAICHAAGGAGGAAFYLPMRSADEFPFEALQGLEAMSVVCIDDVDAVSGQTDWEQALLALYERQQRSGGTLVVTGRRPPGELWADPSLASRLAWGLIFQLKPLSDVGKREALQVRAERRGLRLADDAARLLVRRYGTDTAVLFERFEQLDQASLAAKRRLTAGFIRAVLGPDSNAN